MVDFKVASPMRWILLWLWFRGASGLQPERLQGQPLCLINQQVRWMHAVILASQGQVALHNYVQFQYVFFFQSQVLFHSRGIHISHSIFFGHKTGRTGTAGTFSRALLGAQPA